ncbi:DUF6440 family protein [Lactobacillus taiwanensis]|uniref:DUF6440 family protein n=1 Tax=Lactobacillus taiwanensis TaxID=508451 RepID=UPI00241FC242|nr:DUF6440 family protein [Lactobacillus taiwanensis]
MKYLQDLGNFQIAVDKETGVEYLLFITDSGVALTPRLNPTGKIVTNISSSEDLCPFLDLPSDSKDMIEKMMSLDNYLDSNDDKIIYKNHLLSPKDKNNITLLLDSYFINEERHKL